MWRDPLDPHQKPFRFCDKHDQAARVPRTFLMEPARFSAPFDTSLPQSQDRCPESRRKIRRFRRRESAGVTRSILVSFEELAADFTDDADLDPSNPRKSAANSFLSPGRQLSSTIVDFARAKSVAHESECRETCP